MNDKKNNTRSTVTLTSDEQSENHRRMQINGTKESENTSTFSRSGQIRHT
jgi:hypothetical protein